MNIKLITKALHTLSLLSDEDYDLLMKLRSLNESEREALVLVLEPQKTTSKRTTKKPESKPRKGQCAACDYFKVDPIHHDSSRVGYHVYQSTKSARASGIGEQLSSRRQERLTDNSKCIYDSVGKICLGLEGDAIHDMSMGYSGYHPFVAPVATAATAAGRSSRESSTDGSGVSSGTPLGEDGVAASVGG